MRAKTVGGLEERVDKQREEQTQGGRSVRRCMDRIPMARPSWDDEMRSAAIDTLDSGQWVKGKQVKAFGEEFAEYCGVTGAAPCQNGSSALWAALKIANIGPGDEVIVPSYTFISTATCIVLVGATPVFVDVERDYFCLDVRAVRKAITSKTRAIIGVHLYGQPYNPSLVDLCQKHSLVLVEDAAQAHGATQSMNDGSVRIAGAMGDLGCFSFFPSKNMAVGGEGGMLTATSKHYLTRIQSVMNHGRAPNLESIEMGSNLRMSEVSAAIGRKQLARLTQWVEKRRETAHRYTEALDSVSLIHAPKSRPGAQHAWHQYCVKTKYPEQFMSHLSELDIDSRRYYTTPIHKQQIFSNHSQHHQNLPVTDALGSCLVAVPIMHELTESEILRILSAFKSFKI